MAWAIRSFHDYLLEEEVIPANSANRLSVPGSRKTRTEYRTDTQAK